MSEETEGEQLLFDGLRDVDVIVHFEGLETQQELEQVSGYSVLTIGRDLDLKKKSLTFVFFI